MTNNCIWLLFLSFVVLGCNKTLKVKTGTDAFDVGQYSVAATLLEEEWNGEKQAVVRSDKAFLLGQSYERMNEPDKALEWFRKSADNSTSPSKLIYFCLLYTSDAADERSSVDLGGRRIIKKKNNQMIMVRRYLS